MCSCLWRMRLSCFNGIYVKNTFPITLINVYSKLLPNHHCISISSRQNFLNPQISYDYCKVQFKWNSWENLHKTASGFSSFDFLRCYGTKRVKNEPNNSTDVDEDENAQVSGPTKTIKIFCAKCSDILYRYRKGGNGALVKCFIERIAEDYTNGDMKCAKCGNEFARLRTIKGKPAHKIIGGKVFTRK